MDDKEKKEFAELISGSVAKAVSSAISIKRQDRTVTARDCDQKSGQILQAVQSQVKASEAQAETMNEIREDVNNIKDDVGHIKSEQGDHLAWHEGVQQERSDANIKIGLNWKKIRAWVVIASLVIGILGLVSGTTYAVAKISVLADEVAKKVNGK